MSKTDREVYSFSKLSAFDTCPRMWQLTYLDKVPKLPGVFAEYGTLTHSVLERYAKGELPLSALPSVFDWEWDVAFDGLEWPPNKYVDLASSYREKGIAFFRSFKGFPKNMNILGVEQHFQFPIDDFDFQGFVDLAYELGGKLVILDWKTAKVYTKADLLHKQRQPYLYSEWAKNEFGRFPDEIQFYHTRDNKNVALPFQKDAFEEARRWAVNQVHTIRTTWDFPPKPSEFFCKHICSVRGACKCGQSSYWRSQRNK